MARSNTKAKYHALADSTVKSRVLTTGRETQLEFEEGCYDIVKMC